MTAVFFVWAKLRIYFSFKAASSENDDAMDGTQMMGDLSEVEDEQMIDDEPRSEAADAVSVANFLVVSGHDVMHNFSATRVLDMFECFFQTYRDLDTYMKCYIEVRI